MMQRNDTTPFDPKKAIELLRQAVADLPAPSMFALRARGYGSLFQQLVACMISVRTYEEVSLPASIRLLERAPTAADVMALNVDDIDRLIAPSTFHERKAVQILEIARVTTTQFDGDMPCDEATVLAFSGIGPKCAALALGIACGQERLPVDIHVHRVANRWGVVRTRTPEQTQLALQEAFPSRYWLEAQRAASAVREGDLHPAAPSMLHLSAARNVPAGRCDEPALNLFGPSDQRGAVLRKLAATRPAGYASLLLRLPQPDARNLAATRRDMCRRRPYRPRHAR